MAAAVGVDLGGTKVAAGIVGAAGDVSARDECPTPDGSDPDALCRAVAGLVDGIGGRDLPVGIGAAGLIDYEHDRYVYGPNLGLRDFRLAHRVSDLLGVRAELDNDANCACWGEHRFGSGRGTRHFLLVTLGTGIGGGMVVDGRPYRGARGGAMEIGHMLVDPDGPECPCGRRGCWEALASGTALERMAGADGREVTAAARSGDARAREILDDLATWIGLGLASLVNVLEPERIAIGGGLVREWDLLGERALSAMRARAEAAEHRPLPDVVPAELGTDAGIVGAALLVLDPREG